MASAELRASHSSAASRRNGASDGQTEDGSDAEAGELSGSVVNGMSIGRVLGRGAYGVVYLATDLTAPATNHELAVKVMSRSALKAKREFVRMGGRMQVSTALDKVRRELAIMRKVSHPCVVRCHNILDDEANDRIFLVLELVRGGEAMSFLAARAPGGQYVSRALQCAGSRPDDATYDLAQIHRITADALEGLEYLHSIGIVHRDLKPENILLTGAGGADATNAAPLSSVYRECAPEMVGRAKLADLGVAHMYDEGVADDLLRKTEGTPAFHAPEATTGSPFSGKASDMWALGCCVYAFTTGQLPFAAAGATTQAQLYAAIQSHPIDFDAVLHSRAVSMLPLTHEGIATAACFMDFVQALLAKDVCERLSVEQARQHPWITGHIDHVTEQLAEKWRHRITTARGSKSDVVALDETEAASASARSAPSTEDVPEVILLRSIVPGDAAEAGAAPSAGEATVTSSTDARTAALPTRRLVRHPSGPRAEAFLQEAHPKPHLLQTALPSTGGAVLALQLGRLRRMVLNPREGASVDELRAVHAESHRAGGMDLLSDPRTSRSSGTAAVELLVQRRPLRAAPFFSVGRPLSVTAQELATAVTPVSVVRSLTTIKVLVARMVARFKRSRARPPALPVDVDDTTFRFAPRAPFIPAPVPSILLTRPTFDFQVPPVTHSGEQDLYAFIMSFTSEELQMLRLRPEPVDVPTVPTTPQRAPPSSPSRSPALSPARWTESLRQPGSSWELVPTTNEGSAPGWVSPTRPPSPVSMSRQERRTYNSAIRARLFHPTRQ